MIGELPELDNFFNKGNEKEIDDNKDLNLKESIDDTIYIYISKEQDKWIVADFISIAVAGIGIHIMLPIDIELTAEEINNVKIRFIKKRDSFEEILKEVRGLVRWQERDAITGKIKLGLHFPVEFKNDQILIDILKEIKNS